MVNGGDIMAIYVCNNEECKVSRSSYFGLCMVCRNGVGVEQEDLGIAERGTPRPKSKSVIKRVDSKEEKLESSRITPFKDFNNILGSAKGFVEGQVVLLGAAPGVGKSTLCTILADSETLYISSEENYTQVNQRALRVNPKADFNIMASTSQEEILEAIYNRSEKFIIVDSLNSIDFGVGYQTTARYASEITQAIKEKNKIAVIISQVAKSGEVSGMNSIPHVVDTIIHMERSENSSKIICTSSKNRFGVIGEVCMFEHKNNGLVESPVGDEKLEPEDGLTYTNTRFGRQVLTIPVESLCATSSGGYGMVRSSGYSQVRVSQILGVLSKFGKIDFTATDVYVSLSNGLSSDDIGIELAIANSILSSRYGKKSVVLEAYGEIRLSGRIIGGTIDGEDISHINELISLYK